MPLQVGFGLVDLAAVGEDALLVPDLISAVGESDVGSQSALFEQFSADVARHHHLRVDLHVTIERPLAWKVLAAHPTDPGLSSMPVLSVSGEISN